MPSWGSAFPDEASGTEASNLYSHDAVEKTNDSGAGIWQHPGMTDHLTKTHRSWNMGRIRSRDTKPEMIVRSLLHRMGFRFRVNRKDLPGKPDIVLPKYRTVIFVHGCFWHRHKGCRLATMPGSNREFWEAKFKANQERDKRNRRELVEAGWRVIIVWECELNADPVGVVRKIADELSPRSSLTYPLPERGEILKTAEKQLHYRLRNE